MDTDFTMKISLHVFTICHTIFCQLQKLATSQCPITSSLSNVILNYMTLFCDLLHIYRIVKLSSPYLNIVFIIGISMVYLLVVILGVDDNLVKVDVMSGFCQATVWIGMIAFTLVYGVVLAKIFKVFYIFKNLKVAKPEQKKVSYYILILFLKFMDYKIFPYCYNWITF